MRRIRYYHMFPCAIPVQGADHPRVTHPSAASPAEAGFARLACLRRAASVRSEPGSNSPSLNPLTQGQRNVNFIHPVCSHEPAFPSTLPLFAELTEACLASSLSFPSLKSKISFTFAGGFRFSQLSPSLSSTVGFFSVLLSTEAVYCSLFTSL